MEYLFILLIPFLTALFVHVVYRIKVFKSTRQMLFIPLIIFVLAIICDSWLVSNGIIVFELDRLMGIKIGYLPIEEYLFYLAVPYIILVLYKFSERHL